MHWILSKFSNVFITLFGVVTVVFFLFNILPGDPAQMMLGQNEDSEQIEIVKKNMVLINLFLFNIYTI